jgi:fibronectin-binding autotransporter adhesin
VDHALALATAVTVNAGELALGVTAQNVAAVRLVGGLLSGGSLTGTSYTVESGTVSSILSGAGVALTKNEAGTALLSRGQHLWRRHHHYGGHAVARGVRAPAGGGFADADGRCTLDLAGFTQTTGALLLENGSILGGTLGASVMTVKSGSISAVLDGAGALTKTDAGTVTLAAQSRYTGGTTLNDGRLVLAVADALVSNSQLNVNGGFLDLSALNQTVGQLALTGGTVGKRHAHPRRLRRRRCGFRRRRDQRRARRRHGLPDQGRSRHAAALRGQQLPGGHHAQRRDPPLGGGRAPRQFGLPDASTAASSISAASPRPRAR